MTVEERQLIIKKLINNEIQFKDLEADLRNDREIVKTAVSHQWDAFQYVNEKFKNDREIVETAVFRHGENLQYASEALRNDKEIVKMAVANSVEALQYAGEALKDDEEVMIFAVMVSGNALQYASEALRNNVEIVGLALLNFPGALQYAGEDVRKNRKIVLQAVTEDGDNLQFAGDTLRNDKDLVKIAVLKKWYALRYAGEAVKNDKEIVVIAIMQDWCALGLAGEDIRNDPEIIELAASQDRRTLVYAGEKLKDDDEFIIKISEVIWNGFDRDQVTKEELEDLRVVIKKIADHERLAKITLKEIPLLSSIIKNNESLAKVDREKLPQEFQELLKERRVTFKDLKRNPHWKQYLAGKNCEELFDEKYRYAFRYLGDRVINLGIREPEKLERMINNYSEHIMAIWQAKAKFIPSYIIMKNMPINDIDKFIQNKGKWAELAGNAEYQSDDVKLSLLKVCYALGVFENQKKGYTTIKRLINSLPQQLESQEYQKLEAIAGIETVYKKITEERYVFRREEHIETLNYLSLMNALAAKGITNTVLTPSQYADLLIGSQNNNREYGLTPINIREMIGQDGENFIIKSKPNGYVLSKNLLYQIGAKPDKPLTKDQYEQIDKLGAECLKKIFTRQKDGTYRFNMRVVTTEKGELFLHEWQDPKGKNIAAISNTNKKLFDYTRIILRESGLTAEANMLGANARQNINLIIEEVQYNKVLKEAEAIKDNTKKGYQRETVRYEKIETLEPEIEKAIVKAIFEQDIHIKGLMTPKDVHRVFDKLTINYDKRFGEFLGKYIDQIIEDPISKQIRNIQERYSEIVQMNPGKEITLATALTYITNKKFMIVPGFEKGAEYAKNYGYSQEQFQRALEIWKEAREREASSIARVKGKLGNGCSFEVLRLDDPLGIFVGELTNCCQALDRAGQSSMEHSMKKLNGRVLVIRDDHGEIVGQGWLWEEKAHGKRVICIDNLEVPHNKNSRENEVKIKETVEEFVRELVKADDERMTKLLEEGKLTKAQYESNQLTMVTIGLKNSDVDFSEKQRVGNEELILPRGNVYTDAKEQAILYKKEVKTVRDNIATGILAIHRDELNEKVGHQISLTDIQTIRNIEMEAYNDNHEMIMMANISTVEELGKLHGSNPEELHVIIGVDWYMVYVENGEKIRLLDIAKTPKTGIMKKSVQERETAIERIFEKIAAGKTLIVKEEERMADKTVQQRFAGKRNQDDYNIQELKALKEKNREKILHQMMLRVSEREGRGKPTNSSERSFGG
ncbi:MAG TPA: DUF4116 domain-containing protein [Bacillota bacterium]|nr:DUF4116 domain-containing protein [Bacillota bacterium]HOL10067.1 DUF4116 domain-containing protein [Bacillota bacterium]HPO98337.1 DUF4116 domain-containing protein [Bacillota bacterium]